MKAVEFQGETIILGPPKGWNNGDDSRLQCGGLPVQIAEDRGMPVLRSFWRPSPEELA